MSVVTDIHNMVDRLKRSDIPLDKLAYEVEEHEWRELTEYCEQFARYQGSDLSYADDLNFMGLHIRKRDRSTALPSAI